MNFRTEQDFYEEDRYLRAYEYDGEEHYQRVFYRAHGNFYSPTDFDFVTASSMWTFKVPVVNAFRKMTNFDINLTDAFGNTALFMAVVRSNKETVKALINLGININHQNNDGSTALMYCVSHGDWAPMTELLIKAGSDVNIANNSGNTALMYAIVRNNAKNVDMLIKAGADVRVYNIENFGPRAFFKRSGKYPKIKQLITDEYDRLHQRVLDIENTGIIEPYMPLEIIEIIKKNL